MCVFLYSKFSRECNHPKQVLVGGIKVANDWQVFPFQESKFSSISLNIFGTRHPVPRATDRVYILTSALALCPDLAPPSVRASREPTIEDLEALIVDEGCGLRPARQGGIRLEVDSLERGDGRSIPVVYNYG